MNLMAPEESAPLAEAALARALLAHASKAVRGANPVGVRLCRMPTLVRI